MRILGALTLLLIFPLDSRAADAGDRSGRFKRLETEYDEAMTSYMDSGHPQDAAPEELVSAYLAWPGWEYLPKFVALAEENPADDTALACCDWIFDRCYNVGNDQASIFAADERAWQIVTQHHASGEQTPLLCFRAVSYSGPAREQFLRHIIDNSDSTHADRGFATLALGVMLAERSDQLAAGGPAAWSNPKDPVAKAARDRIAPQWLDYMQSGEVGQLRAEARQRLQQVLDEYADVPVNVTAPGFRNLTRLGDKAAQALHAVEHLIVGKEAPAISGRDLEGNPMSLAQFHGKVVVLSFWFTGCGPCMGMIDEEQALLEAHADQPLVLLGVCRDKDVEQARFTVREHGMTWPHWHDGEGNPITRDYNVTSWPTFVVIDQQGRLAAIDESWEDLKKKVSQLLGDSAPR